MPLENGLTAQIRFTSRSEGDFSDSPGLAERRRKVVDLPWTALRQRHGARAQVVGEAGRQQPFEADSAVTDAAGAVISVRVADCAPVSLVSPEGVLGVIHAGWRGIAAGVVEAAVNSARGLGARRLEAFIGPCIHPECYEFDASLIERFASRFGHAVRSETAWGSPALSLPEMAKSALRKEGVTDISEAGACTSCEDSRWFSHRARKEKQRHALAVWKSD